MGKRSAFPRIDKDAYQTWDPRAVAPLLPHLWPGTRYCEPCAGEGRLIEHLAAAGHHCVAAYDINPARANIGRADAREIVAAKGDLYITNPPWKRPLLHPIIANLSAQKPTWLLFDADWIHTAQSAQFRHLLLKYVSIGRVKWFPDSPHCGKDNCAWHLFSALAAGPALIFGREKADA